jgi:hypothetical protein
MGPVETRRRPYHLSAAEPLRALEVEVMELSGAPCEISQQLDAVLIVGGFKLVVFVIQVRVFSHVIPRWRDREFSLGLQDYFGLLQVPLEGGGG